MAEDQNGNGNGRLSKLADNAVGKIIITYVIPLSAVVIGYLIQDKLTQITTTQHLFWAELGKVTGTQASIQRDLAVITTGMQSHKIEDEIFESNTKATLQDHEARLRAFTLAPSPLPPLRRIPN
jgi:hypothetical protein